MLPQGTRVRVLSHSIAGHCRTPHYLKGKIGEVVELAGAWRNPEQLAYHRPGLPTKRLYRIRFMQSELWDGYPNPGDTLEADIYEHWLESVEAQAEGDGR
ncbi:MAG: SH3-like domain-containing protein [Betaproteobacteria bacterium]